MEVMVRSIGWFDWKLQAVAAAPSPALTSCRSRSAARPIVQQSPRGSIRPTLVRTSRAREPLRNAGLQPEPGRSSRKTSGACGRANARAVRTTKRREANASPDWPSSSAGPRGTSHCHLRLCRENDVVDDSTVRMKMDSLTYRPHRWVGCAEGASRRRKRGIVGQF